MATIDLLREHDATPTSRLVPTRGLVVAAIVVGLGASLVRPSGGNLLAGDLAILAMMAATAILGANEARRLVRARTPDAEAPNGSWLTVIVARKDPPGRVSGDPCPISSAPTSPGAEDTGSPSQRQLTSVKESRSGDTLSRSHRSE